MAVSVAQFREDFPPFSDALVYTDLAIERKLQAAARQISESIFGDLYDDALGYLAAHMITSIQFAEATVGTGGLVPSSVSAGAVSISYANAGAASGSVGGTTYGSTAYGQEFERIRRQVIPGILVP